MADFAGLHISRGMVRAVRASFSGDGWKTTKTFSSAWSDAESLAAALKECFHKFGPEVKYAVAIPQDEVSVRPLSFPFSGHGAIMAALPFEMESALPFPAADMETSYVKLPSTKEETKTLAFAARRERLSFYRAALKNAEIDADLMTPEAAALLHLHRLAFAKDNDAGAVLLAEVVGNEMVLCFADDKGFADMHSTYADASEITRFISAVGAEPSSVYLGGEGATTVGTGKYGAAASWRHKLEAVFGSNHKPESILIPLGLLALAESGSADATFPAYPDKRIGLPTGLKFAAVAAAVFLLLALGNLGYGYYAKKKQYEDLRARSVEIFNAALPGAKAVKPAVQLKQKIESLDKKMRLAGLAGPGRADLLWVLKRMSETLPDGLPFEVDEVLYEDDMVTVSGKTDKFESITRIKELYSIVTPFKGCDVADSKATADGKKVSFKLRMHI